jgi:hypothetical protein
MIKNPNIDVDCNHNPPLPHCRLCQLHGRVAGGVAAPQLPVVVAIGEIACRHLGKEPVGLRDCPTCAGRVRLKAFRCALGLGVAGEAVPSVDCGPQCSGFSPGG